MADPLPPITFSREVPVGSSKRKTPLAIKSTPPLKKPTPTPIEATSNMFASLEDDSDEEEL